MAYKIFLGINQGEEGFTIPVLPEKITITEDSDNKSCDIINLGEVNTINKPKLSDIKFESFFPLKSAPYVSPGKLFSPITYINKIKDWRNNLKRIRLIFIGDGFEINDLFSIESFEIYENAGEVGDIYYSISLKRYKTFSSKKVKINVEQNKPSISGNRPSQTQSGRSYTVVKGDCLWNIAKKFYGNGALWNKIYDANTNKIVNPNLIYPGQVLRIP